MITQNTIDQILSRIDIIDIIGGFVKLKKRGANYLGLCPFHNEKTPSFTVSATKEIYKCFGCGRSGNSISFLMEHEKYSYIESIKWLGARYNVEIEETAVSPEVQQQRQLADSLYIVNQFAQKYFSETLFETDEGLDVGLTYLKERGFREDIIHKFQLGYCLQQWDAFAKEAISQQFNADILQKSGLVISRNDKLLDNYRGRIIFPVHNQSGKILGFGARLIGKADKAPKYINTPENEIYVKSKILYGSYFARQAIDKNDECLLVEGYTDVISLHQAGIENVVASGGTSLTQEQLRLIKKYTPNLTILYDGDSAGVKAALRGLDLALEEGLNVKLVLIPDNEDPDSYVNKLGANRFSDFISNNKKDFILFQIEVSLKEANNDSNKKATLVNQVAETISKLNKLEDFTKQQDYIKKSAELLQIEEVGLTALVNKFIKENLSNSNSYKSQGVNTPQDFATSEPERSDWSNEAFSILHQDKIQEQAVVRALLEHGLKQWDDQKRVAEYIFEAKIDDDLFEDKTLLNIISTYKDKFYKNEEPTIKDFAYSQNEEISKTAIAITNFPYEISQKWNTAVSSNGVNKRIWNLPFETFMGEIIRQGDVNPEIYNMDTEDSYKEYIDGILGYIKLRKIRKMIIMNQQDFLSNPSESELNTIIHTHNYLKLEQMKLGAKKGIVIFPF